MRSTAVLPLCYQRCPSFAILTLAAEINNQLLSLGFFALAFFAFLRKVLLHFLTPRTGDLFDLASVAAAIFCKEQIRARTVLNEDEVKNQVQGPLPRDGA